MPSEPATFVQRLLNVFQTPMTFGARWVVVVQTSLVHCVKTSQLLLLVYLLLNIHTFTCAGYIALFRKPDPRQRSPVFKAPETKSNKRAMRPRIAHLSKHAKGQAHLLNIPDSLKLSKYERHWLKVKE